MDSLQKKVAILQRFYEKNKRLPAYSEMLSLFGVKSKNAVYRLVQKLLAQGVVQKDRNGKLIPGELLYGVKILGDVEAGFPSPAEEELADAISIDDYLIQNRQATFLLRVSGNSMINAGLHPGDLVLVDKSKQAKNDDIVVACVDSEWTIKRLQKSGSKVVLMPENPKFKPIVPAGDLVIGGVVIGVVRKY